MTGLTTTAWEAMLDHIFGGEEYSASISFALFTDSAEIEDDTYARVELANDSASFPAAAAGAKTIAVDIIYPAVTGNVDGVRYLVAFNDSDEEIARWALANPPLAIPAEEIFVVEAGTVVITGA